MKLTREQTKHIAKLARLRLSEAEIEKFGQQLSSILEYIALLNEVDTENVAPTAQTTGLKNVSREDSPSEEECLTQEEVLSNAPEKQDGHIKTTKASNPKLQIPNKLQISMIQFSNAIVFFFEI